MGTIHELERYFHFLIIFLFFLFLFYGTFGLGGGRARIFQFCERERFDSARQLISTTTTTTRKMFRQNENFFSSLGDI
jgi:hypothetical protein